MSIDVESVRRETPGCSQVVHFNNAGASLPPVSVILRIKEHLDLEAAMGGYEAALETHEEMESAYQSIAKLIGASREEIAATSSATRAWDMAFYSLRFQKGDRILTSMAEYASNYISMLQVSRKTGAVVDVVPDDEYGQISVEALEASIDKRTKLIALTHVPTSSGLVNPAEAVGKVASDHGVLFLLDACQSTGQMPIDVSRLHCDMLSATSRKFLRGPRGAGFLYVRKSLLTDLEPPFLDLHSATWTADNEYRIRGDAGRFEEWETNVSSLLGLGTAVNYCAKTGIESIWSRVSKLGGMLREELNSLSKVVVLDRGERLCGIVTFNIKGKDPLHVRKELSRRRINVWTSEIDQTRLDLGRRSVNRLIRASVHYYNTEEEIQQFVGALKEISMEM